MDQQAIFELIDGALFNMENSTCDELMDLLNYVEHVATVEENGIRSVKESDLFLQREHLVPLRQHQRGETLLDTGHDRLHRHPIPH